MPREWQSPVHPVVMICACLIRAQNDDILALCHQAKVIAREEELHTPKDFLRNREEESWVTRTLDVGSWACRDNKVRCAVIPVSTVSTAYGRERHTPL